MFSKLTAFFSVVFTAGLLASGAHGARAENLNTAGTVCRNYNAREALAVDYLSSGARNIGDTPLQVICPIPRPSQVAGGTGETPPVSFFVDGSNQPGTTTTCTVYSFNYDGVFFGAKSFTIAAPITSTVIVTWDRAVSFPIEQLPLYGYASVLCTLPANAAGLLFGATALR